MKRVFLNFFSEYEIMKLMSDLKNLSLQDKNGVRRGEEIDIVVKKA